MRSIKNKIQNIEKKINLRIATKRHKIKITSDQIESIKSLCLHFREHFGLYGNSWLNEDDIDHLTGFNPNIFDENGDEALKKRGYLWITNLVTVCCVCVCQNLWDDVNKVPELKPLMKYQCAE